MILQHFKLWYLLYVKPISGKVIELFHSNNHSIYQLISRTHSAKKCRPCSCNAWNGTHYSGCHPTSAENPCTEYCAQCKEDGVTPMMVGGRATENNALSMKQHVDCFRTLIVDQNPPLIRLKRLTPLCNGILTRVGSSVRTIQIAECFSWEETHISATCTNILQCLAVPSRPQSWTNGMCMLWSRVQNTLHGYFLITAQKLRRPMVEHVSVENVQNHWKELNHAQV